MPYHKICAYPPCHTLFTTPQWNVRHCSVSCASKNTVVQSNDDVRAYVLKHIEMPATSDGCWIWNGPIKKDTGYGIACVRNTRIPAHRLTYEVFVGLIPKDLQILHGNTCHSRACVNPEHLRPGTHIENMQDKRKWGEQVRGQDHPAAALTETQVLHILQAFHDHGQKMTQIARWRRLPIGTVHDIIHRKTWTHVAPGLYPPPADQRATLTLTQVREMRRLHEQRDWSYQAITMHMNRLYPELDLLYGTTLDVCTYRTWTALSPQESPDEPPYAGTTLSLDEPAIRQMHQEYAAACAEAQAKGMKVKITRFARRYAERHGISNMAIRMILNNKTHKHITP